MEALPAAVSRPVVTGSTFQEAYLLAFFGNLILGLLIAGVSGLLFSWLWDRFAPKA